MTATARADQIYQAATFQERGVAVPFTTPVLAGTRARGAARGVEFVVPHPAGARGVYIMTWSEVGNFCAATLHDLRLAERLSTLKTVSPFNMRQAARAVAQEGLAGRAARDAAKAAEEAERTARLMTNIALLQCLVQQQGGGACPMAELDRRAKAAILALSPGLGRAPETITNDIEALAGLLTPTGVGLTAERARLSQLAQGIGDMAEELKESEAGGATQSGLGAGLVLSGAEVTLAVAQRTMADARGLAQDMPGLLKSWAADPSGTAARLSRTDWLLDGWEQICLVWRLASEGNRRGCVSEMALMMPTVPQETEDWLGASVDDGERQRLRKLVHSFEDWRTGSLVFDLVARNERIRALAA